MIALAAYSELVIPALTIWREARGESFEEMLAVAWVIRNRMRDKRWPTEAVNVCLQPKQFSCFNPGDPNASKLPNPSGIGWAAFERACKAWESCEGDPTGGANHYETLADDREPTWAEDTKVTLRLGKFEFYRL